MRRPAKLAAALDKMVYRARLRLGIDAPMTFTQRIDANPEQVHHYPGLAESELGRIFLGNTGRVIHKWLHYFEIYERYLHRYRGSRFRMMEIGVAEGGSLEMWRRYFGPEATLFGIDINPRCAKRVDPPNQVRIGSQDDPSFLRRVVDEMGGIDVVLDDGSHVAGHQRISFQTLFPLLADGGLYIVEDLHTAYWPGGFDGGYRRAGTAIEFMKSIVDDMHHWYHGRPFRTVARGDVAAVHIHDSIMVIEKRAARAPLVARIGAGAV